MIDRLSELLPDGTIVDAVVIGAGMAGLSAGAELARARTVVVLEMESTPAFHTTGRSAAVYIERYGGPAVAPFNLASLPWFSSAADGAVEHPLLAPRGMVVVAAPGTCLDLEQYAEPGARLIDGAETQALFPALRPEAVGSAVFVPEAADLDAAGAVLAFRRLLRERGGTLVTSARVERLERRDGSWEVTTRRHVPGRYRGERGRRVGRPGRGARRAAAHRSSADAPDDLYLPCARVPGPHALAHAAGRRRALLPQAGARALPRLSRG